LCALLKTDSKGYSVGVTTNGDKEVKKMYIKYGDPVNGLWVKNPAEMVRAKKKLYKALDFILEYAKQRKKHSSGQGLTGKEAVMISRLYMYLEKEYRSTWKLENPKLFYDQVKTTFNVFCNDKCKDKKTAPVTTGKQCVEKGLFSTDNDVHNQLTHRNFKMIILTNATMDEGEDDVAKYFKVQKQ
jgi:hypothetical protein